MADSTSNLAQMAADTAKRELVFNALLDAASPATLLGRDALNCTGLTWAYYGGKYVSGGSVLTLANGTLSLTASSTNYIEIDPVTATVSSNTSGFTAGRIRLYSVVAGPSTAPTWTDYRQWGAPINPRLAISLSSDANRTLTDAEARAQILDITSSVSLTATRNIVLPLVPRQWTVYNGTTGAQSLQFIGPSGTGVVVANTKRRIIYADGTNVVPAGPDV